jgi:methylthioribose-1-phosphate isomerase
MVVRGAPAIGVSAAYGIALGALGTKAATAEEFAPEFDAICACLAATRPTAVNLFWAIDRMKRLFANLLVSGATLAPIKERILAEAHAMYAEDIAACKTMGAFGGALLPDEGGVLTHCNAGALATCGYGTALGVIRSAVEQGKRIQVFADETRPFLQGARLTAWELMADGIPTTVICDNMAASIMRAGRIQAVVSRPTAMWPTRSAPIMWRSWPRSTAFRSTWPRLGPPSTWRRRPAKPFPLRSGRRWK